MYWFWCTVVSLVQWALSHQRPPLFIRPDYKWTRIKTFCIIWTISDLTRGWLTYKDKNKLCTLVIYNYVCFIHIFQNQLHYSLEIIEISWTSWWNGVNVMNMLGYKVKYHIMLRLGEGWGRGKKKIAEMVGMYRTCIPVYILTHQILIILCGKV